MNSQSQIEAAEILLQVAKGRKGEYLDPNVKVWFQSNYETLCTMAGRGRKLRLKPLSFPSPPEGEEWDNVHHLTPEQFEVQDGWRPLLKSESNEAGNEFWESAWKAMTCNKNEKFPGFTYRTKRPLPEKKPKFEVGKKYPMRDYKGWVLVEAFDSEGQIRGRYHNGANAFRSADGTCAGIPNLDLLPEEVTFKKVRIGAEDWKGKPVVWVRESTTKIERLVVGIFAKRFCTLTPAGYDATAFNEDENAKEKKIFYPDEFSYDRVTWHPFEKEIEV